MLLLLAGMSNAAPGDAVDVANAANAITRACESSMKYQ